jgi:hypothetical protein
MQQHHRVCHGKLSFAGRLTKAANPCRPGPQIRVDLVLSTSHTLPADEISRSQWTFCGQAEGSRARCSLLTDM